MYVYYNKSFAEFRYDCQIALYCRKNSIFMYYTATKVGFFSDACKQFMYLSILSYILLNITPIRRTKEMQVSQDADSCIGQSKVLLHSAQTSLLA